MRSAGAVKAKRISEDASPDHVAIYAGVLMMECRDLGIVGDIAVDDQPGRW